jgi:hypothetical protein
MATKIQLRRDTAANWQSANPVLSQGEPGLEIDTGAVRYGDGISTWNTLPSSTGATMTAWSGNKWQFDSSAGGKSFLFKTAGHVRTDIRLTAGQAATILSDGTLTVSVAAHPTVIDSVKTAWDNWDNSNGSQPYWLLNDNWYDFVSSYTLTGDTMIVNLGDTYTFQEGDVLQLAGWDKGTQALFDTYFSTVGADGQNLEYTGNYYQPTATVANTNSVTVDFTLAGPGELDVLQSGSGKNYIVFDPYTNNNGRRITSVAQVSGNTYTITFTGEPIDLKAKSTKTLVCKPSRDVESGTVLYLSKQEYPQLIDYLNVDDDSVYFTINDDPTQYPIYYFWPRGGNDAGNSGVDYRNNWALGTESTFSYLAATDTITLHYIEKGTFIRLDYWFDNATLQGETFGTSYDRGYRWFSWENDLPHFKDAKGNGVQGGWLDYHIQCTWPDGLSRASDNRTFSIFFDPKGNTNGYNNPTNDFANGLNNFRYEGYPTFSGPAQPDGNGYYAPGSFGGGWDDLQFSSLWDFYEDGIFFNALSYGYDDGNQQEIKVDIMWNARIFYADTPMVEPNDR